MADTNHTRIQQFGEKSYETEKVLRVLRDAFRTKANMRAVQSARELTPLEKGAIFALSYASHFGTSSPVQTRGQRWMSDFRDYVQGGELPYYVMRTHYGFETEGLAGLHVDSSRIFTQLNGSAYVKIPKHRLTSRHLLPIGNTK